MNKRSLAHGEDQIDVRASSRRAQLREELGNESARGWKAHSLCENGEGYDPSSFTRDATMMRLGPDNLVASRHVNRWRGSQRQGYIDSGRDCARETVSAFIYKLLKNTYIRLSEKHGKYASASEITTR